MSDDDSTCQSDGSESILDKEPPPEFHQYGEEYLENIIFQVVEEAPEFEKNSCCSYLTEIDIGLKLHSYCEQIRSKPDLSCMVNMVNNFINAVHYIGLEGVKEVKYSTIDLYLRFRHDLLHNLAMESIGLNSQETDEKFCDKFEFMDSIRSPDRIIIVDKMVIIMETTATSDTKKSFITKGKIEEGFKSKYEREVNQLHDHGYSVEYLVLIFDMKDLTNFAYQTEIKKASKLIEREITMELMNKLEMIRGIFCRKSSEIMKLYSLEVGNLLTERFDLSKPALNNIDFLLVEGESKHKTYDRVSVSTAVYSKINSVWGLLPHILNRTVDDLDCFIVPTLDHSTNKFTFSKSHKGVRFDDMMNILVNDDKPTFTRLLIQTFEKRPISFERSDIEFFEQVENSVSIKLTSTQLEQERHINSTEHTTIENLQDYSKYVDIEYYRNVHHLYEDSNYETKLIDSLCDFYNSMTDKSELNGFYSTLVKQPFCSCEINESVIDNAVYKFKSQMEVKNNLDSQANMIKYQKQPFLQHLADGKELSYGNYKNPPVQALNVLSAMSLGEYTAQISHLIKSESFCWGSRLKGGNVKEAEFNIELKAAQSELYKIQIDLRKKRNSGKLPKLKEIEGHQDLKNRLSAANSKLSAVRGPHKSKLSQVRIPTKRNSIFGKAFQSEMDHFKKKKTTGFYKGVGMLDYEGLKVDFKNLKISMLSSTEVECPDEIYFDYASTDSPLLHQFKSDYLSNFRDKYKFIKNTSLYASCCFVSRLCHSLAFYSQTAMGSDYCSIDNLGYSNVLLMVKGGKKIFKTKKTKLFRLLYPVHSEILRWYINSDFRSSTSHCHHEGVDYLLTPWHSLDEVVLNDGLTFLHRTISYVMLSHESSIIKSFNKNFFNLMLAFHSRRKTEELLHNVRYICVNSISNISRLDLMLPELADFNYDFFQSYIRSSISENYTTFSKKLLKYNNAEKAGQEYFKDLKLQSIFDDCDIETLEDLTVTIYSTFLMSKSPTNQSLEQVGNLKNMMKTKKVHMLESSDKPEGQYETNGITLDDDGIKHYWNNLFKSDFNFDPAYCNMLGKFSGDYLSNIMNKGEVNSKWLKIVNESWDDFANTKGLRGFDDEKFFNRKGYYIVYDNILKDGATLNAIKALLTSDRDDFYKRKELNKLNKKYRDKMGCKNMKEAIFHVVDKKQRGGSREIFVMDLETKINQQAIEKYLSFLCRKIPNEAISVPSNKRLQHIHTNVFEKFKKSDYKSYNATLDCRKWAPHSVINKFIDFMLGMSNYLPDTFITHFLCFFSKMFDKKIYTRKAIKDIMLSNSTTKLDAENFLIDDESKRGCYMEMSYSWIMGIFNYMSSFMHVMNQLHASHIIRKVTHICDGESAYYHMNAHSDDSGGKIQVKDEFTMIKTFFIYELLLKSCNHLLSDKKCNISLRYFEFLSVLYISNTLLSLITKVSGSFNFHPTDTGYCGDVNECYSKCIEMISLGATFEQAYLSMKISSHSVFKFYFNRNPTISDHMLPPQLLGIPDSHPIITLISGSDSDIIRLTWNNGENFDKFLFMSNFFNISSDLNDDIIKPIKANPNIRKNDELTEHSNEICVQDLTSDMRWIVKNLNTKNTGLKLIKYGLMLDDKKFVSALIDETITRRISRAYHFRNHDIIPTPIGIIGYKKAKACINLFMFDIFDEGDVNDELVEAIENSKRDFKSQGDYFRDKFTTYELMNYEVYGFVRTTEKITYTSKEVIPSLKTCKPIHVNMQKTGLPTAQNFDPTELCVWIKYPEHRWIISMGDDYNNKCEQVTNYLSRHDIDINEVEPNWLYTFLQKLKTKYVKEYFIYSNMPNDVRDVSNFQDFLCFLAHNSFKNKFVQGIMSPLGATVSQPISILFKTSLDKEALDVITFINYCFSIATNFDLFKEVCNLKIDPTALNCESSGLYDLICELITKWELRSDFSALIVPHLWSLRKKMDEELFSAPWLEGGYYYCFTKSQKLIGNVWLGKGELFVNTPRLKLSLSLLNGRIDSIQSDKKLLTLTNIELSFLNSVLMNANLPKLEDHFKNVDYTKWETYSIGSNSAGLICIDQLRNLKLCFQDYTYTPTFNHYAARPSLCEVKLMKNFSYTFTHRGDIMGDKKYNINVLKIQPSEMLDLITNMYDNKHNRKIIESKGENFGKYMKMFIGNVSGAEFRVTQDQLFDLLPSTKIYALLRDLVQKDLLSKESMRIRKHIYPGQHGGLLSCFIDFKNTFEDFDFDYNLILSPELMALKSSQPESFVSNLITNIKEKYDSLYSSLDKEIIRKELIKLSTIISGDKSTKGLMGLLMNWGYIGIMGSLEEMLFQKKAENYSGVRLYIENNSYQSLNESALVSLIKSIFASVDVANYFNNNEVKQNHFVCRSTKDFKKVFISFIHSNVLSSYKGKNTTTSNSTIEFLRISETMKLLMKIDGFNDEVSKNFEQNVLLSLLPVDSENWVNMMVMIQTLASSYSCGKSRKHKLNFIKNIQHDHDLIRPYSITKDLLSQTPLRFKITSANNHGFISRERLKMFSKHHLKSYKSEFYDINFNMTDQLGKYLPMNKFLFCNKQIKEGVLDDEDSEFADIMLELESEEPDLESYGQCFFDPFYEVDYSRKSRLMHRGSMITANRYEVSVVMLPQLAGDSMDLNFIRNISQTVMILTNHYIPDLIECDSKNIGVFHFCNDGWENFSLVDPECLLAYLIDSKEVDIQLWSNLFNMHSIDKVELTEVESRNPTNTVIDRFGNIRMTRRYSDFETKMELMSSEEKPEEDADEVEEEVEDTDKIETLADKLMKKGFDKDLIKQLSDFKKIVPIDSLDDFYAKVLKRLEKSTILQESLREGLKVKVKEVIANISDVNQATKIFEVANVFSAGPRINSNKRNRSLKDEYIRAEVNSLMPGAIDLILSGTLSISEPVRREFTKHVRAMRKWAATEKNNREKKLFMLDLSCLIVNDAYEDDEKNHDHLFKNLMSTLTNFVVEEEEDEDYDFIDTYKAESRRGRLYYDW